MARLTRRGQSGTPCAAPGQLDQPGDDGAKSDDEGGQKQESYKPFRRPRQHYERKYEQAHCGHGTQSNGPASQVWVIHGALARTRRVTIDEACQ